MEDWTAPLHDASTMRAVDAWAIEERGIPSLELMEAAGLAVAEAAERVASAGPIRVVCGKGNNGGDGLVAARRLAEFGHAVEVLLLCPGSELSADAAANLERFEGPVRELEGNPAEALTGSGAVIDAIFGTGFEGAPRAPVDTVIDAINECGAPTVAADVASGVDASSGEVAGTAVRASVTVSFHAAKVGHRIAPGKTHCGELVVALIGIPEGAPGEPPAGELGPAVLDLPPRRGPSSTKFTSGEVLVAGGSRGLTGAVCLAASAATRAGAGYATVAVPDELEPIFEAKLTEAMSRGCASEQGALALGAADAVVAAAERSAAVVLGPGLGRRRWSGELVAEIAARIEAPLLIDADGLNAVAGRLESLASRAGATVLTPHAGELGRLLEVESAEVDAHRLARAREAAERASAVVVLKGDDTIVAEPAGRVAVNALAAPALATAGTGDVLGGTIAALIARGLGPFEAACAGVYAHARAGRIAAERIGGAESVIAGDVIEALPAGLGVIAEPDRARRRSAAVEAAGSVTEIGRALAVVDVGAVERNCARLARELGEGVELCAVVKADGYGHGAVECARAALAGGATRLAVAAAAEAAELRDELPEASLFVMGALTPGELEVALDASAEIAVWRPGFLELVRERSRARGVRVGVHVKYDTGMGRLGERDPRAVEALVDEAAGAAEVELAGLWTHFATADEPGSEFFRTQLERFATLAEPLKATHPELLLHAANSAATLTEPASHFGMVRCGVAIYGLDPFGEDPGARELEPALALRSYVADVKAFEPGASAGYGQRWFASERTHVGVLPIGYGDGVRRALSNNAEILVRGRRRALVGTVSMDNLTIELGPEPDVEPGDPAVLIGAQDGERILAEEVARRLSTINYEVTCAISPRVPRTFQR